MRELTSRKGEPRTRSQAFAQLAAEQGRNEGTFSANYYRVAVGMDQSAGRTYRRKI